jgi:hypothetical protein
MNALFRTLAWLTAACLLLAVFAFLYLKTQELNVGSRDTVSSLLRDLRQIDAEIDNDVLRSKTGLNKNYDPVARAQQLIGAAQQSLASQKLENLDYSLKVAEKGLTEALAAKLDLVDRFKAQNAILKNSLRFLPTAADDVKQKLREARDASGRPLQLPALADGVEQILVETLKLDAASDNAALARVRSLISLLVQGRSEYPGAVGDSFDIFANHVITILAQKEREDDVLEQMANVPVSQQIDSLGKAFAASFAVASDRHDQYRLAMFGYGAFLLVLLAFVFGRAGRRTVRVAA